MKYAIGLDIGGTKIEGILADSRGRILKRVRKSTYANKPGDVIINNIVGVVKELRTENIEGVGVSICGVVTKEGELVCCPNILKLQGANIVTVLRTRLRTKIFLENDANCFALAEHRLGAAKGHKNVVGLIIGTGIGAGIIINNKLYRGSDGGAGEFGHTIIDAGRTFESLCSGPNIVKRYKKLGGKASCVKEIFPSKEKNAKKVMEETYKYLGVGLANIVNSLNPDVVVLGGGLSNLPIYKRLNKEVKKRAIPELERHVKIVKNKLGDSSGVLGAVQLAFDL